MSAQRLLSAAVVLLLSAGCSGLFRSHDPATVTYQLRAPAVPAAPARVEATLVIARPAAHPGLDGDRIVVLLPDRRVDAYAGARWSASLPRVVEALLADGFRASDGWRAVVTETSAFPGRYLLQTDIVQFTADYSGGGAPVARVTLRGELGVYSERRLVASLETSAAVPAAADRQHDVAAAFEAAYAKAAVDLIAAINEAALAAEAPKRAP